jgi:type II secretory pathway pseudopilin PulG
MKRCLYLSQRGLTLLELTVVLLIMIALAGTVVPYVMDTGRTAQCQTTDATMQAVKAAIMGGPAGSGYYADLLGRFPRDRYIDMQGDSNTLNDIYSYSLHYLFVRDDGLDNDGDGNAPSNDGITNVDPDDEWRAFNAQSRVGWHGPYLQNGMTNNFAVDVDSDGDLTDELHASFGDLAHVHVPVAAGDQVVLDGWGRPIVLQVPPTCPNSAHPNGCVRLVSAGPIPGREIQQNGIDTLISDVGASNRGDDRVLFLQITDPRAGGNMPCDPT